MSLLTFFLSFLVLAFGIATASPVYDSAYNDRTPETPAVHLNSTELSPEVLSSVEALLAPLSAGTIDGFVDFFRNSVSDDVQWTNNGENVLSGTFNGKRDALQSGILPFFPLFDANGILTKCGNILPGLGGLLTIIVDITQLGTCRSGYKYENKGTWNLLLNEDKTQIMAVTQNLDDFSIDNVPKYCPCTGLLGCLLGLIEGLLGRIGVA